MNRLAITRVSIHEKSNKKHLAYILLDEKRDFVDFQVFDEETSLVNRIFVGRVENIVPSIKGAFVRILPKQICYLPLEDVKSPIYTKKLSKKQELCIGDELVVQVIKDAVKTKEPVISTKLTLTGNYCVLTTDNLSCGVSKKITGEKHDTLNRLLLNVTPQAQEAGVGIIIRTNAIEVAEEDIKSDVENTLSAFLHLKENAVHQCAFAMMYQPENTYIQKLKTLDLSTLDSIYTDFEDIYNEIERKLPYFADKGLVKLYNDDKVSLLALYNFKGSVDKLIEKKVWLKSGANIIIEQLETLTVIDVNSGKNIAKNQDTILAINKEAAIEIARQLRLRNISGMIIIDFINLASQKAKEELISVLRTEIKKDSIPTQFIDITKLGLIELTRKKVNKSLLEMIQ